MLDFTKKIGDTICQIGTTLTEIGLIALEDNPEVGEKIMKMLQDQVGTVLCRKLAKQISAYFFCLITGFVGKLSQATFENLLYKVQTSRHH